MSHIISNRLKQLMLDGCYGTWLQPGHGKTSKLTGDVQRGNEAHKKDELDLNERATGQADDHPDGDARTHGGDDDCGDDGCDDDGDDGCDEDQDGGADWDGL